MQFSTTGNNESNAFSIVLYSKSEVCFHFFIQTFTKLTRRAELPFFSSERRCVWSNTYFDGWIFYGDMRHALRKCRVTYRLTNGKNRDSGNRCNVSSHCLIDFYPIKTGCDKQFSNPISSKHFIIFTYHCYILIFF